MGKGGSGGQTTGYRYMMSLLFGMGRGPINELVEIEAGDKKAWQGNLSDDTVQSINKPNLFGGDEKEGGIVGKFRLFPGRFDQVLPGAAPGLPSVKDSIGGLVSEFRNVTMLWFDGEISAMNPYPKEWKFRLRRSNAGWYNDEPWYPKLARILMAGGAIHAMNPAHIIYQCLTDTSWGRGLDPSKIDVNSFVLAANTLCDEGFGLCFLWQRDGTDVDEFILEVREHIAAELYLDPETGLMTLKLLRKDYVAEDLPLFTPSSGLLEVTDDDSASQDATFNEMIGTGYDPITNQPFNIRAYNNAARQSQGAPNSQKKSYDGIPTRELMARVLQRELKLHASGLKKVNVALDRRAWRIRPGMCFRIQDTRRGIQSMILRAVEITDGGSKSGRIQIKAMEDVYGLPDTAFVTPVDSSWVPPQQDAQPAAAERLIEANYRDLRVKMPATAINDAVGEGVIATVALAPDATMYEYDLATKAAGETDFVVRNHGAFTGAATLLGPIGPYDTEFTLTGVTDFNTSTLVGQAVLCDDEEIGVTAWDEATGEITVKRGVGDTIPVAHAAGATVWTLDDDAISDLREYLPGETVEAKVLTRSVADILELSEAATLSLEVVGRWNMPYPPGDVRVAGDPALTLTGEHPTPFDLTWVHRDRLLQDDQLVGHDEASMGPEAGTTYTVRIYDSATPTVAIRTVTAIAGELWTYDAAMWAADGSPTSIFIELESERDGLVSYQHYRFSVVIAGGYGYGYGLNYGGN
jgi:hypothetical protein